MSKKSKPGDGSYGKGTKGGRQDLADLFQAPEEVQPVARDESAPATADKRSEATGE